MNKILFCFFVFILYSCSQQNTQTQQSTQKVDELARFIPEGYVIRTQFDNDMDLDSTRDIVLILEIDTTPHDSVLTKLFGLADNKELEISRSFLILIRQEDGSLIQAAKNDILYQASTSRWVTLTSYFPEPEVSDGRFGYTGFFFHGDGGHSETDIRFEYSPKHNDWLLMEIRYSYTSDTPTEEEAYDNTEGSFHKTQKDFGIIGINDFDGSLE